ncbi:MULTISPECIES: hypothetical protein [Bradyrhizobium]|uniref:hypothetical protein n=1 Tax=Bradyrhizobium elkanii TaxID=29448 RepID=UPI0004886001|nr:hypothetical protein [Bradyrhizobium elkanii]
MAKDQTTTIGSWRVNTSPVEDVAKTALHLTRISQVQVLEAFRRSAEAMPRGVTGLRRNATDLLTTTSLGRRTQEGWQVRRIIDLLPEAFPPDGRVPSNFSLKVVQARLKPAFEKRGLKEPSTDSISRALGRRDRRG